MNVNTIIKQLKSWIPEHQLGIPKRSITAFLSHQLISSMDIIKSNWNYSIEGAVKLCIYLKLRRMGIWLSFLQIIEKAYMAERIYAKELNFYWYVCLTNIFTEPILFTLADKKHFISIEPIQWEIQFLNEEDYIMSIAYGKHMADYIHGRIIFDIWEMLEILWFEKQNRTKWLLNSMQKVFEKNQFPIKIWKDHYLQNTKYYDKPKQLWQSFISAMSEPNTIMTLRSNNHGYITNIKVTKRKKIENDLE